MTKEQKLQQVRNYALGCILNKFQDCDKGILTKSSIARETNLSRRKVDQLFDEWQQLGILTKTGQIKTVPFGDNKFYKTPELQVDRGKIESYLKKHSHPSPQDVDNSLRMLLPILQEVKGKVDVSMVAEKLKVSLRTTYRRLKRLEDENVIVFKKRTKHLSIYKLNFNAVEL